MNPNKTKFALIAFLLCYYLNIFSQVDRNFWFVAPQITQVHGNGGVNDPGGQPIWFRFTSMDTNDITNVKVYQPANTNFPEYNLVINPKETQWINVTPDRPELENYPPDMVLNNGVKIEADRPITAYYEVDEEWNNDIYALKGENALGTEFYVPGQRRWNRGSHYTDPAGNITVFNHVDIVATEQGTVVTIIPSREIFGLPNHPAGVAYNVNLNAGQTYSAISVDEFKENNLAGTKITSNKKIAVTVSDDSMNGPGGCYDLCGDQLIPTDLLGLKYIALRGVSYDTPTDNGERVFINAISDGTDINIDGAYVATINEGEVYDHEIEQGTEYCFIELSEKAYAYQVCGFTCELGGAILPTVDEEKCTGSLSVGFNRSRLNSSNGNDYWLFLNVMVRQGGEDKFNLNVGNIDWGTNTVINSSAFVPIPGSDWSAAQFKFKEADTIPINTACLIENDSLFHFAVINGAAGVGCRYGYFSDYGENEALAYVVGSQDPSDFVCWGDSASLYASGGYTYSWSPSINLDDSTSSNPVFYADDTVGAFTYICNIKGACNLDEDITVYVDAYDSCFTLLEIDEPAGCSPLDLHLNMSNSSTTNYSYYIYFDTTMVKELMWVNTFDTILVNNSLEPDTILVSVTGRSNFVCDSYSDTVEVVVYPSVTAGFFADTTMGCSPLTVSFTDTSINANSYYWNFGNGTSFQQNPIQTFNNASSEWDRIFEIEHIAYNLYSYGLDSIYCMDTAWGEITVHPFIEAQFTFSPNDSCSPYYAELENSSQNKGTISRYLWDFGDGETLDTTYSGNVFHEYTADSSSVNDTLFIVSLTVIDDSTGCFDSYTDTIYVRRVIDAIINADLPSSGNVQSFSGDTIYGCHPMDIRLLGYNSVNETGYLWNFGDGASTNDSITMHLFENFGTSDTTYQVILEVNDRNRCYDYDTIYVNVAPFIQSCFTFDPTGSCSPYNVELINNSTDVAAITYYRWVFGDGDSLETTNLQSPFHEYTNTQPTTVDSIYSISLTVRNAQGCEDTFTDTVVVFPEIRAEFTMVPDQGCDSLEVFFTNASEGEVFYEWEFGDGASSSDENPMHMFVNNSAVDSNYVVKLLVASNAYRCQDSAFDTVTVFPFIKAKLNVLQKTGCHPFTADFYNASINFDTAYIDFGDGSDTVLFQSSDLEFSHVFTNDSVAPKVYTVRMSVHGPNCSDSIVRYVEVYPAVIADFSCDLYEGCDSLTVVFTNESSAVNPIYNWDFGDNFSAPDTNTVHTFKNFNHYTDTTYHVVLTVTSDNYCETTHDTLITVFPRPLSDFSIGNSPNCSPANIVFYNECEGNIDSLWIDFSNGTSTTYANPGFDSITEPYQHNEALLQTYPVEWITLNDYGCYDTVTRNVVIYPYIEAEFNVDVIEGCDPLAVQFTDSSVGALYYEWNYGDGFTTSYDSLTHTHIFRNFSPNMDSVYRASLTVSSLNNCVSTYDTIITVLYNPRADFAIDSISGCSPHTANYTYDGEGEDYYIFEFGDGTDTSITNQGSPDPHIYQVPYTVGQPQTFNVTMTSYRNDAVCTATRTRSITVFPDIFANFVMDNVESCSPLNIQFTDSSSGADNYEWTFGDGTSSSSPNPAHSFHNYSNTEDITYDITLTVSSDQQCYDDTTQQVIVHPVPNAKFALNSYAECSPFWVSFIDSSSAKVPDYLWKFGNGDSSNLANPDSILYVNQSDTNQIYTIDLQVTSEDGCVDSTFQTFTAYPEVIAQFSQSITTDCSPLVVQFTNTSQRAQFYDWRFGDGNNTSWINPEHTFTSNDGQLKEYYTYLIATSDYGCMDTSNSQLFTVVPMPQTHFIPIPEEQTYPNTTFTFLNQTPILNAWDYSWNFGDNTPISGNTSQNVVHTYDTSLDYSAVRTFVVQLSAQDPYQISGVNCISTYTDSVKVFPPLPIAAFGPSYQGCLDINGEFWTEFVSTSQFADYHYWNFGDGSNLTTDSSTVTHRYVEEGVFYVELTVSNAVGDSTARQRVSIYKKPTALFRVSPEYVNIPGESVQMLNNSSDAEEYFWDFGDGNVSYAYEPEYEYSETGVYDITLIAYTSTEPQCSDTMTIYNAVTAEDACALKFPNAFKPNTNGATGGYYYENYSENDIFRPLWEGILEYHLEIFNRWGELVFATQDIMQGWDGYYKGELAKQDVYVWKVSAKCTNGSNIKQVGDVMVIY